MRTYLSPCPCKGRGAGSEGRTSVPSPVTRYAGGGSGEVTLKQKVPLVTDKGANGEAYAVPYDAALPGLALLHRPPAQVVEALSPLLANCLGPDAQFLDYRIDIRRYVPGKRCLFEIEVTIGHAADGAAERRCFIGKLYSGDQGANTYETLQQLWCHGFATGYFFVPQPLAYDPAWHLLILSSARGESLRALLLSQKDVSRAVDGAAKWLLKLHTCGFGGGRLYDLSRHLHTLALWKRYVTEVYPEAGRSFGDVLGRVEEQGSALAGWTPAPTHRDFSPDHLLVEGNQLTGLDFDEFCYYDPLFDVAHFIGHLRFLGLIYFGRLNQFDSLADRFQASYEAGAQDYSPARVCLYQAIAYLKLAHIAAVVRRPQAWEQIVGTLLREAQRCL